MRPPRIQRSNFRYPLDDVLGTPATVRLIRVLVYEVGGPVGVGDAAKRAGLSRFGTLKSLEALERLGVVTRCGTGRAIKFGPKEGNTFLSLLRELFALEQRQHEELLQELRQAVAIPEIQDAWLRDLLGKHSHTLDLSVVAQTRSVSWMESELRTRLTRSEKRFDVIIEVCVFTRADSPKIPDDAIMLWGSGVNPDFERPAGTQTHAESAERSLRMSRSIAEMIKSDPSLIRRALQHTNRLLREGQGTANSDIGEWRHLLETYSPERLRDLLVSKSSRAERLRRSSPFFPILTPDERDRVLKQMESEL
jgi:DNA-binding Lrp family transcriptional regulator